LSNNAAQTILLFPKLVAPKTTAMKKLTKEDISQEVFDLYDDYAHNNTTPRYD
jgi:hypothetical protein